MSAINLSTTSPPASSAIERLVDTEGTRAQPHARALASPDAPMRDLSDALHVASMLHARYPGIIDHAVSGGRSVPMQDWLAEAAAAFADERQWLTALVAAVGPLPSTPGHAESEAAVLAQCHALDTLAQSDRVGCAAGAAVALVLDWRAVRDMLDAAGERMSLAPTPHRLPEVSRTGEAIDSLVRDMATERAALFGARQFLTQQRGLWNLLEARASARDMLQD